MYNLEKTKTSILKQHIFHLLGNLSGHLHCLITPYEAAMLFLSNMAASLRNISHAIQAVVLAACSCYQLKC